MNSVSILQVPSCSHKTLSNSLTFNEKKINKQANKYLKNTVQSTKVVVVVTFFNKTLTTAKQQFGN